MIYGISYTVYDIPCTEKLLSFFEVELSECVETIRTNFRTGLICIIAKCNEFIINIVMDAHILILNRTCKKQARQNKFEAKGRMSNFYFTKGCFQFYFCVEIGSTGF